jgi:hypothetical protein
VSDIKDKLKRAKRRQVTEPVCLRGDLASEYDDLERQLGELPKNARLAGDPERLRITAEMERVRAEMREDTVDFVLKAMPQKAFQTLVDEHPPRRDGDEVNEGDARFGFDRSTFPRALIRATVIEPTLDDEDWELLLGDDGLSSGQFARLREVALAVNGTVVDVPFSPDASSVSPG